MAAVMLPLLLLWGSAEAANEQETNIGDFLFDDQKLILLVAVDLVSATAFRQNPSVVPPFVPIESPTGNIGTSVSWFAPSRSHPEEWTSEIKEKFRMCNSFEWFLLRVLAIKRPGVGVHEHDMLSTTCGLDVLDVPQSTKRPAHLGVYGHPSKSETSYKMLFVMMEKQESEFEEDVNIPAELIHSFETEEEHSSYSHSFRETLFTISRF
uniref:Uncharacterized protein n=1 Tax=Parascaris equorum TaxID=6256 RepID=A0A914RPC3_PAREQ